MTPPADKPRIAVLAGDGIGPEIVAAAQLLLDALGGFEYEHVLIGGASIDATGEALAAEALAACRRADAVLLGAVGGPRWDTTDPDAPRPEQGLLGLRKGLGLYANLRPVKPMPALLDASPLRRSRIEGTDLLVVRELTGGIYFGEKHRTATEATDVCTYTVAEIERIARVAGRLAQARRRRVTSIDKSNVLETSRLWRAVATRVFAAEFPDVALEHMLVDAAAMHLIRRPRDFDVLLTENMFGDILTDEASMLAGSLGVLPSASLGEGRRGLYEPIHGSAPDIAGRNLANPLATILSTAMLLRHSLHQEAAARRVEAAVRKVLGQGFRTADIAETGKRTVGTKEMGDAVLAAL